jgi:argininosuccinate synthase
MEKVILAYSGGLDTSVILKWLINKGHDVICFLADVGQEEDFAFLRQKALLLGASKVYVEDLKKEFVENYIFRALKAGAIYEGRYLLGTSLARPLIAQRQVEVAKAENCTVLAHGATGKGNDQVRFELAYYTLLPGCSVISPWKNAEFLQQFSGRTDMIEYATLHGIPITSTLKKPYSIDANLMHTSYEAGILEDPSMQAPQDIGQKTILPQQAQDITTEICIEFLQGIPIAVENLSTQERIANSSVQLFSYLNDLCGQHGIGRVDIVENRYVGMKSRGVYETPAGTVLWKAHLDLEACVLDREVFHIKEQLMPKIAQLIYNGFWFSPEMDFLMTAIETSQQRVTGKVYMQLYKGNASVTKRYSQYSLYNQAIVSMDTLGGYDQLDAKGFIKLNALRLQQYRHVNV